MDQSLDYVLSENLGENVELYKSIYENVIQARNRIWELPISRGTFCQVSYLGMITWSRPRFFDNCDWRIAAFEFFLVVFPWFSFCPISWISYMLNGMINQRFMQNVSISGCCSEVAKLAEHPFRNEKVSCSIPGSNNIFTC